MQAQLQLRGGGGGGKDVGGWYTRLTNQGAARLALQALITLRRTADMALRDKKQTKVTTTINGGGSGTGRKRLHYFQDVGQVMVDGGDVYTGALSLLRFAFLLERNQAQTAARNEAGSDAGGGSGNGDGSDGNDGSDGGGGGVFEWWREDVQKGYLLPLKRRLGNIVAGMEKERTHNETLAAGESSTDVAAAARGEAGGGAGGGAEGGEADMEIEIGGQVVKTNAAAVSTAAAGQQNDEVSGILLRLYLVQDTLERVVELIEGE